MIKFKVTYNIAGFGSHETQLYNTYKETCSHLQDIKLYEGVSNAKIILVKIIEDGVTRQHGIMENYQDTCGKIIQNGSTLCIESAIGITEDGMRVCEKHAKGVEYEGFEVIRD